MLSRVANNLFWMDRYMERSYGKLLLLKVGYLASQDAYYDHTKDPVFIPFIKDDDGDDSLEKVLIKAIFDDGSDESILSIIYKARENARSAQEHISKELWLNVNKFFLYLKEKKGSPPDATMMPEFLEEVIHINTLYYGLADITQERGNAFCFMNNGKYMERVLQSIEFLKNNLLVPREKSNPLTESVYWKNLLLCIGGYQIYLKTHKSSFERQHVIELMILNQGFPRSLRYGVSKLKAHINRLNPSTDPVASDLSFHIGKLESEISFTTIDEIMKEGLEEFLKRVTTKIHDIHALFDTAYFSRH